MFNDKDLNTGGCTLSKKKKKIVDKLFILDAKHLISFERSLKELYNGISKYRCSI
jgi:hypothetical protein